VARFASPGLRHRIVEKLQLPVRPGPGTTLRFWGRNRWRFELTEQQIAQLGLTWGLGLLIALMLFIIWDIARKSNAGKLGAFALFFVLAFGILGFIAKSVIKWLMGIWERAASRRPGSARSKRSKVLERKPIRSSGR